MGRSTTSTPTPTSFGRRSTRMPTPCTRAASQGTSSNSRWVPWWSTCVQGWRPLACMSMHAVASADSMMRHELFTCYKVQNSQPLNQPLPAALNGYWQLIARAGEGRAGTCRTARPVQCELDHVHRHWHRMPRPQCEFRGHQRRYLYPHRQYFGSRDRLEAAGVQPAIFRKLRFPI